jgi:amino-acid N-acetyltransferase
MIRKARIDEVPEIYRLLTEFASQWDILPRKMAELYGSLRDYFVYRKDQAPILGLAALHIFWENLGEIRSLAVLEEYRRQGIGSRLVESCLAEDRDLDLKRVFALTSRPGFFLRFGFREVTRDHLPPIIWAECVQCLKFPDCDEIPMLLDLGP